MLFFCSNHVLNIPSCIGALPAYLAGVEDNKISLKLQKTLLNRWWHVNVCAMQVKASYAAWIRLFDNLLDIQKGDRIRSIAQNGFALGKRKNIKCDGELFGAFICAYWERHMKELHHIYELSNKLGHYYPLMVVCLMLMLYNLQEVKTMQRSNFNNNKDIRKVLPADDRENGIYGKDTSNNQANDFFE